MYTNLLFSLGDTDMTSATDIETAEARVLRYLQRHLDNTDESLLEQHTPSTFALAFLLEIEDGDDYLSLTSQKLLALQENKAVADKLQEIASRNKDWTIELGVTSRVGATDVFALSALTPDNVGDVDSRFYLILCGERKTAN